MTVELTREEAIALAEALEVEFFDDMEEDYLLHHEMVDPAYVSALRKLWLAARNGSV